MMNSRSKCTAQLASAALTWVLKDGIGLFAGVLSSGKIGEVLCRDVKKVRCLAFFFLGVGLLIDLSTIFFPAHFLLLAGISNGIKSMCFISISGSNSAIHQHYAISNNLADITAKCCSQNTLGTFFGFAVGSFLSLFVNLSNIYALCPIVLIGTSIDLLTAYYALSKIEIPYINTQKMSIIAKQFLNNGEILSPYQILSRESFLLPNFLNPAIIKQIVVGQYKLSTLIEQLSFEERQKVMETYENRQFICILLSRDQKPRVSLTFRLSATYEDILYGYYYAASLYHQLSKRKDLTSLTNINCHDLIVVVIFDLIKK